MAEQHPKTAKLEEDRHKQGRPDRTPALNAVGLPEPEPVQPVAHHHPDRPIGERQDGPGTAPHRPDRTDAIPAGSTHAARSGANQGRSEEPDAAHRGQPARFATGEAQGSGASAGGTKRGAPEEPATDSASGAGRE